MGTAILRSHDCLQRRFLPNDALLIPSSQIRSRKISNPNPNCKSYVNNNNNHNRRRKRSPVATGQANQHDRRQSGDRSAAPVKLVMGQVKILKRGEKLSPEIVLPLSPEIVVPLTPEIVVPLEEDQKVKALGLENSDLVLGSTDRFGPDPITMQKQIRVLDSVSKDGMYAGSAFVSSPPPSSVPVPGFLGKNGVATSDLRRLLRLDLE